MMDMKRLMVLLVTAAVVAMQVAPVGAVISGQGSGSGGEIGWRTEENAGEDVVENGVEKEVEETGEGAAQEMVERRVMETREETDLLKVMFWNLENFFDFIDGGSGESDTEFSSDGPRRWTKKRFYRKCQAIAKTILWAGSAGVGTDRLPDGGVSDGGGWGTGLPDIVGVAEVENRFVLRQLVEKTALRKLDYRIVHFDSPDPRGIDCALLYRGSRLTLVSARPCRVSAPGLQTRDILLAQFLTPSGDSLAVLVNHHPSKYGGGETDWRREVAVARLRALGDSLAAAGWTRAVALGDFNDVPENALFRRLEPTFSLCRGILTPSGAKVDRNAPGHMPRGSIRFNGEWQLIDLCFVTTALADRTSFRILEPPFLTERDAAHSGDKPLRTYSGPRYLGGVSDHRPIMVYLQQK